MKKTVLLTFLILTCQFFLYASPDVDSVLWSGSMHFSESSNGEFEGAFKIESKSKKVRTSTGIDFGLMHNKDLVIKQKISDIDMSTILDTLPGSSNNGNIGAKFLMDYSITPSDIVSGGIGISRDYRMHDIVEKNKTFGRYQGASVYYAKSFDITNEEDAGMTVTVDLGYTHKFNPNSSVSFKLNASELIARDSTYHEREEYELAEMVPGSDFARKANQFLRHLRDKDNKTLDALLKYEGNKLLDIDGLKGSAALRYSSDWIIDIQNSENFNQETGSWIPITMYDAHYDHFSYLAGGLIDASYRTGSLSISGQMDLQYFHRIMYEFIPSSGDRDYPTNSGKFNVLGFLKAEYAFKGGHSVALDFKHSLLRPDYTQISNYCFIKDDMTEIIYGNQNLEDCSTNDLILSYKFASKRFKGRFNIEGNTIEGGIEKVLVTYLDLTHATQYKWMNTHHEGNIRARVILQWRSDLIDADINTYFGYKNIDAKDKDTRPNSINYGMDADFALKLKHDWKIEALFSYISPEYKAYSMIDSYMTASARVSKTFDGRFQIFLMARDIFNQPVVKYSWGEDDASFQDSPIRNIEATYALKKAVVAGLTYTF